MAAGAESPCPSCGARVGHLLGCEHNTISLHDTASALVVDDEASHLQQRAQVPAWAVPLALTVMTVLSLTDGGRFMLRIFFGMWLHEMGHALASWCCGVMAVPLPWITLTQDERSPTLVVLLLVSLASVGWRWWKNDDRRWVLVPLLLAAALGVGVLVPLHRATVFMVFSGDAGAMVLGTVSMLSAFLPGHVRLARGGLPWGFVTIGAGAFVDSFGTWVRAWRDVAELPFGRSEASGLSDASRLVDTFGWSETFLVRSYLAVGLMCLAVLAVFLGLRLRKRS